MQQLPQFFTGGGLLWIASEIGVFKRISVVIVQLAGAVVPLGKAPAISDDGATDFGGVETPGGVDICAAANDSKSCLFPFPPRTVEQGNEARAFERGRPCQA